MTPTTSDGLNGADGSESNGAPAPRSDPLYRWRWRARRWLWRIERWIGLGPRSFWDVAHGLDAPLDDLFDALTNWRRRQVLRFVDAAPGAGLAQGELAMQIAMRETGKERAAISSDERKRVYVSLYQAHLPKLDRLGLLDWSKRAGAVRPTPATAAVARQLRRGAAAAGGDPPNAETLKAGGPDGDGRSKAAAPDLRPDDVAEEVA